MKFLVTGASGFLGYHLCKYLVAKGYQVRGIDINDFDYPNLKGSVEFIKGDIRDEDLVVKVTKGVDVIIHGAAALPLLSRKEIFSVNVDGTRNILQAVYILGGKRVIYISSTSIYGIPKTHPVDEYYPLVGVGAYGESKIMAEMLCVGYRKKGLCVATVRPKTFAGAMRLGVFQILCDWVLNKKNIPIIGSGKNKYQLLHVDDLMEAIYLLSVLPEDKVNDIFNIGATKFGTMKEDLQALLDYAGFGKHVVPIPSWLVIPVLKVLENLKLSPLYEWVYETADKDHYVSVEKIQKLGWTPKKSTADVWIDTYSWYREESQKHQIGIGKNHRLAWKQGMLSLAKVFF